MTEQPEYDRFVQERSPRLLRVAYLMTRDWAAAEFTIEDWLAVTSALGADDLVLVKTNAGRFNPAMVPGVGQTETLTADSLSLLNAVHDDTVAQFLESHPDWVA